MMKDLWLGLATGIFLVLVFLKAMHAIILNGQYYECAESKLENGKAQCVVYKRIKAPAWGKHFKNTEV